MARNKSKSPARVLETVTPVEVSAPAPVATPSPVKVKRSMKGINASGNAPWRKKFYGLNKAGYEAGLADGSVKKAAGQVQGILRYMASDGFKPARGGEICYQAIAQGFIKTVIAPDVLFAYYRKAMEDAGWIVFLGYIA